jgi:hypothetical protein
MWKLFSQHPGAQAALVPLRIVCGLENRALRAQGLDRLRPRQECLRGYLPSCPNNH